MKPTNKKTKGNKTLPKTNNKGTKGTKVNKRKYIDFDLEFIFNNIYIPVTSGDDNIKTLDTNPKKFLIFLRMMGEVTRRYSKEQGTFYNVKTNEDTIEFSRVDISTLLTFYPISEDSLVNLYYRLLESGIDPNVIEDMMEYREYLTKGLGWDIPRYTPTLVDYNLIERKTFQEYLNIN